MRTFFSQVAAANHGTMNNDDIFYHQYEQWCYISTYHSWQYGKLWYVCNVNENGDDMLEEEIYSDMNHINMENGDNF